MAATRRRVARPRARRRRTRLKQVHWVLILLGVQWVVELVNLVTGHALTPYGIVPRTWSGLPGILAAPFLHASFDHLLLNTLPFLVLGWLITISERADFGRVTAIAGLGGGLAVWLFARGGHAHVGASGLISGYLGFLLARGVVRGSLQSILIAVVTLLLYGGLMAGILPGNPAVSWESHLFGFLAGIAAARW